MCKLILHVSYYRSGPFINSVCVLLEFLHRRKFVYMGVVVEIGGFCL